ncbi:HAD family hydrolase [Streptomyces sp. NPDC006798]|uniref:HAD family hydrolase n=1 Tax=Streptomyces sp. NPDC006798 TaxID=3155462 RepID=UPI0033F2853D
MPSEPSKPPAPVPYEAPYEAPREALYEALDRARCVVLDLDGPVADVFGGRPASAAARLMLETAERRGCVVEGLRDSTDPIAVLRGYTRESEERERAGAADGWDKTVAALHDLLDRYEREAAETAGPTPGAAEFITACHRSGRRLAVATNNHAGAAERILERMGVLARFDGPIVGRSRDAGLMKPHPWALRTARADGVPGDAHLMIGDAVTDLRAAAEAGFSFCGYHATPRGRALLRASGARLVVPAMTTLVPFVAP